MLQDIHAQVDIDTLVLQSTHVAVEGGETSGVGIGNGHQHVLGLAVVVLDVEVDHVEYAARDAHGEELLFLPSEVIVQGLAHVQGGVVAIVGHGAIRPQPGVVTDSRVTLGTVAHLQGEIVEPVHALQELLFLHFPHGACCPERTPAVVLAEAGAAVSTQREVNEVFLCPVVVYAAEEREELAGRSVLAHFEGSLRSVLQVHQAVIILACGLRGESVVVAIRSLLAQQYREVIVLGDTEAVLGGVGDGVGILVSGTLALQARATYVVRRGIGQVVVTREDDIGTYTRGDGQALDGGQRQEEVAVHEVTGNRLGCTVHHVLGVIRSKRIVLQRLSSLGVIAGIEGVQQV